MTDKTLLVVNPISGDRNKDELIEKVRSKFAKEALKIYRTTGNADQEEIASIFDGFQPKRIIAAGGDGTIKTIAEALEGKKYILGILPAGSSNGLATDLNLPINDMDLAIQLAMGSLSKQVDCISLNNKLGVHISDLGINAALIEKYDNSMFRGQLGYALNSIPTLIETDYPYQFSIKANNKTIEKEAVMLAFANSRKFGTGAIVNPNGKIDDGYFEVLIFKSLDLIEILKTLNAEATPSDDFVEVICTRSATIECKKPVSFQIDGEVCAKTTKVEAEILPKRLKISVGK